MRGPVDKWFSHLCRFYLETQGSNTIALSRVAVKKMSALRRSFCLFGLLILVAPLVVATVPVSVEVNDENEPQGWWTETTVDRNQNKIGDMVELHMDNPVFLDEDNTLPLIMISISLPAKGN